MTRTSTPPLALVALLLCASCATSRSESAKAAAPPSAGGDAAAEASAAPTAAPVAPDGHADLQAELAALAQAERMIDTAFPGKEDDKDRNSNMRREIENRQGGRNQPRANVGEQPMSAAGACATACKALASMSRSADHVCSLAGDGDARCGDARSRVKSATDRVRAACPACTP